MRNLTVRGLTAVLALSTAACADGTGPSRQPPPLLTELPRPLTPAEAGIAQAANSFSFNLLRAAQADNPDTTIFLSPLSVSMALGMTLNGADGVTYDEMRATLGFGTLNQADINAAYQGLIGLLAELDHTSDMRVANSIWARHDAPILTDFLNAGRNWFDAEVQNVDFHDPATLVLVNNWVKEKTNGKIPKLLDSFDDPNLIMTLLNAIYFKGNWRSPFDPKETRPSTFRGVRGDQSVPMMHRSGTVLLTQHQDYTAGELLYGNGAFAMTLVLPAEGRNLRQLVEGLTPTTWATLVGSLVETDRVEVALPRLRLDYRRVLTSDLAGMGMPSAFSEQTADFSRLIQPPPRVLISSVIQKSFLEINEEGTTAAAATAVQIVPTSLPPSLRLDRPFLLVLRERLTGTILFIGQITNIPPAS